MNKDKFSVAQLVFLIVTLVLLVALFTIGLITFKNNLVKIIICSVLAVAICGINVVNYFYKRKTTLQAK